MHLAPSQVCRGSLTLMDSGVGLKVSGVAVGLTVVEEGEHRVLTDITG